MDCEKRLAFAQSIIDRSAEPKDICVTVSLPSGRSPWGWDEVKLKRRKRQKLKLWQPARHKFSHQYSCFS